MYDTDAFVKNSQFTGTFLLRFFSFFLFFPFYPNGLFIPFGVGIMTKLLSSFSFLMLVVSVTSNEQVSTTSAPCLIQTSLVDSDELHSCHCFDRFYIFNSSDRETNEISGLKNCSGKKAIIFF